MGSPVDGRNRDRPLQRGCCNVSPSTFRKPCFYCMALRAGKTSSPLGALVLLPSPLGCFSQPWVCVFVRRWGNQPPPPPLCPGPDQFEPHSRVGSFFFSPLWPQTHCSPCGPRLSSPSHWLLSKSGIVSGRCSL